MMSHSEQQTLEIAAEFAATLKGGEIVFLEGDLGSGKTTFVRGVARSMGFEEPVRSPTFTIMNRYPVSQEQIKELLHLDLYRIEDSKELQTLALEEEVGLPRTVTFIEWPVRAQEWGIQPSHEIRFETGPEGHDIEINEKTTV